MLVSAVRVSSPLGVLAVAPSSHPPNLTKTVTDVNRERNKTKTSKRRRARFGTIHTRVAQRGYLTDPGIKTLSEEMTEFFNTVVLDLDGTAVR